jgi:hypothetical protein
VSNARRRLLPDVKIGSEQLARGRRRKVRSDEDFQVEALKRQVGREAYTLWPSKHERLPDANACHAAGNNEQD